jgi:hypothetical protein
MKLLVAESEKFRGEYSVACCPDSEILGNFFIFITLFLCNLSEFTYSSEVNLQNINADEIFMLMKVSANSPQLQKANLLHFSEIFINHNSQCISRKEEKCPEISIKRPSPK